MIVGITYFMKFWIVRIFVESIGHNFLHLQTIININQIQKTMKKKLLFIVVLLSVTFCANAQDSIPSLKHLPQAIRDLVENMVYVEGGTFTMGNNQFEYDNPFNIAKPEHQVTLSPYFICRYEVTQEVWDAVMGNNFSRVKGAKLPVTNICWDDCQEFVIKLVLMTGINFRLPTEAEWEFAARGGNKSCHTEYSGGNAIDSVAWCQFNSGGVLHPVGQKLPNELGLYDMNGNVWEWCYDYYGIYDSSAQTNPKGTLNASTNVTRGGCYTLRPEDCRAFSRYGINPSTKSPYGGFRLAATPG